MRILVVSNLYPPQELGGYGRSIYDFANVLASRGHELCVMTADAPEWRREGAEDGPHVRRTLELFGNWSNGTTTQLDPQAVLAITLRNHRRLADAIRDFRPDACLVGNIDFLSPFVLHVLIAQGAPALHHLGNRAPGYTPVNVPRTPLFHLATASRWVRNALLADGFPAQDASVIYPGAHVDLFAWDGYPPRDHLRIAFASLVMPFKGPQVLAEALAILRRRNIPFECTIAGDSADPAFVGKLKAYFAEERLADRVRMIGYVPRAKLVELFRSHNVLAFPSVFEEPFGISQVEAMAAGMALVSSATGGASEIVDDGVAALAFRNNDAPAMAAAFQRLHDDRPLWQRLAENGRRRALERFSIQASVDLLEEQLARLAHLGRNTRHSTPAAV
jgi:glycosyltransferase involved in cell wall biosynthesis